MSISSFRNKLNNLINSIYESTDSNQHYCQTERYPTTPTSAAQYTPNKNNSLTMSQITPSNKHSTKRPQITHSNLSQSQSLTQSTLKKQSNILNDTTFSPYTERSSFSPYTNHISQLRHRNNSYNRNQSRITNEIALLSKSFREGIVQKNHINRPVININKPEYKDFNINYITAIANIKERQGSKGGKKNNRKNEQSIYVRYPEMKDNGNGKGIIGMIGNGKEYGDDLNTFSMHFKKRNIDGNKLNKLYEAMINSRNKY